MTDLDALRAAIAANWDEDTPRLIYADALDETGDSLNALRARLIRLSVARSRATPEECQSPKGQSDKAEFDWLTQALAARLNWPTGSYTWDRGFLLAVACTPVDWEEDGYNLAQSEAPPLQFGVFLNAHTALPNYGSHVTVRFPSLVGAGQRFDVITRQWEPTFDVASTAFHYQGRFNARPFHAFPKGSLQLVIIAPRWETGMRATERRWRYTFAYHPHSSDPVAAALENMNRAHTYNVCNMADAIRGEILAPFPEPEEIAQRIPRQTAVGMVRAALDLPAPFMPPRTGFLTTRHV